MVLKRAGPRMAGRGRSRITGIDPADCFAWMPPMPARNARVGDPALWAMPDRAQARRHKAQARSERRLNCASALAEQCRFQRHVFNIG